MTAPTLALTEVIPVTSVRKGHTVHVTFTDGTRGTWRVHKVTHDGASVVVHTDTGPHRYSRASKVRVSGGVS